AAPPARPLDVLWQARAVLWVMLGGEGLAAVLAMAPGLDGSRWVYFGLASLWIQWTSLLTLGRRYLGRRWLNRLRPQQVAAAALAVAVAVCWLLTTVIALLLGPGDPIRPIDWWDLGQLATGITLTVGLLGLAAFDNHWRGRLAAVRAKQAELEALQARIRPHFLFNTLNTGIALVHGRPEEAERLLLDLSDLFRAALSGPAEVSLAEELSLARRYLEIEMLRFGERLDVDWQVSAEPAELQATTLPTLSIQPLVENAIRHGVESGSSGGRIEINVAADAAFMTVTVRNSVPDSAQGSVQ